MAGFPNDPSMEEILSSIKRIIAEDGIGDSGARGRSPSRARVKADLDDVPAEGEAPSEEVLELTEPVDAVEVAPELVSSDAALASREKLASLSAMIVKSETSDNTLEGLVREMLRPMLKEWLDANLPAIVENIVAREVARITSQGR